MPLSQLINRKRSKSKAVTTQQQPGEGNLSFSDDDTFEPRQQQQTSERSGGKNNVLKAQRDDDELSSGDDIVHPDDDDDKSYGRPSPHEDNNSDESSVLLDESQSPVKREGEEEEGQEIIPQPEEPQPTRGRNSKATRRKATVNESKDKEDSSFDGGDDGDGLKERSRRRAPVIRESLSAVDDEKSDDAFEADSDDESIDEEEASVKKMASKSKTGRMPTRRAPKPSNDDDEDEFIADSDAEYGESDEDDEDFAIAKKSKPRTKVESKKKKPAMKRGRATKIPKKSSDDDEDEFIADSDADYGESDKDDEDFAIAKKSTATKRGRAPKKRGSNIEEDSDDEFEEDSTPERAAKQSTRQKRAPRNKARKRSPKRDDFIVYSDDEEEYEELDEDSDDEEEAPEDSDDDGDVERPASRRSSRRGSKSSLREDSDLDLDMETYLDNQLAETLKTTSTRATRQSARKRHTSRSLEDPDDDKKYIGRRRPRATAKKNKFSEDDDENEDELEDFLTSRSNRRRSSRKSASKAAKKVTAYLKEDDDDDELPPKKRSPKKADDDEAFEFEEEANESDGSEGGNDEVDEDDDSVVAAEKKPVNVDIDESFLDPDESDENDDQKVLRTPPSLKIVRSTRKQAAPDDHQWDEDSDDGEGNDESKSSPPILAISHMPFCQSTTDAITMDHLPKKHICFYMPDGKTKQCFALETLHKIALTGTVMYANEKPTFKQPPHFRAPMSDDIVDQIASRFGRAAVDVRGHFYNPGNLEFDYTVNFDDLDDDEEFTERVNKYMNSWMGSRDIYCCPICYTEAHRRLETSEFEDSHDDDSSVDETEQVHLKFVEDPMTIVGCVDGDEFKLASAFCFGKLVQVKEHLRKDHMVDPSVIDGNDLYKRFQIRASDGLLQRYLDKVKNTNHSNHRISRQGEMVSYWHSGNNELFVFLLDLIDRWKLGREEIAQSTHVEAADGQLAVFRAFEERLATFWSTFAKRGMRIWDAISEPYRKATKEELDDFLADVEDVDEPGDDIQYHLLDCDQEVKPTPEEEIISALKQNRGKGMEDDSNSEEEEEEEYKEEEDQLASSADEEEVVEQYYYSEESEEDDWEKEVKSKRKARIKKDRRSNTKVVEVAGPKKLGGGKKQANGRTNPSIKAEGSNTAGESAKKKRRVIQESDSDSE